MKPVKKFEAVVDLSNVSLPNWKAKRMYSQGYRFIGKHSAIKLCEWTKKSIREKDYCYKQKFYCINSHQCIQMSPAVFFCDFNCLHCWRSLSFSLPKKNFKWDSPELIFDDSIKAHYTLKKINFKKISEAESPKHFAISLNGEPTLYPYLPELIDLIKSKEMTAFLVTNGAHPKMLKKLIKHQPTNLYITLPTPDKESFKKECCPMTKDGWEKILESLSLLKQFSCNTVIRLTLNKSSNMHSPELYSKLIENASPTFVECKGYMAIGGARAKLGMKTMPSNQELLNFTKSIEANSSYKIINQKDNSNVILLKKS
jgi:tRNA wybutosine-synthesizing protein 1